MRQLALLLLLILATPVASQTAGEKVYRLGVLTPSVASLDYTRAVTLPELAKLGFSEGRNLVVDTRVADVAAMPSVARELLLAGPDAVIAIAVDAAGAMRAASNTVTSLASL